MSKLTLAEEITELRRQLLISKDLIVFQEEGIKRMLAEIRVLKGGSDE